MVAAPLDRPLPSFSRLVWYALLGGIVCTALSLSAQGQTSSPAATTPEAAPVAQSPSSNSQNNEIVTRDSPTTFKVRVNLVLVRVVVRDTDGKVITNLKQEDFQLFDNRKPQIISSFSRETPGAHVPTVKMNADAGASPTEGTPVQASELPQRFVTLLFDDLHISTQDVLISRQAASKLLGVMGATDRLSIFTTSGQVQQEFTSDREKLEDAIQRIIPRPISNHSPGECPPMTLYEAYQIVEANDPTALQVATQDAAACAGARGAQMLAQAAAQRELTAGESEMQFSFRNLDALIKRMSALPGQRVIVLMSPGFFVTPSMHESGDIIDRATKANIVINAIDSRGLYVSSVYDASNGSMPSNGRLAGIRTSFIQTEESIQSGVLAELADGTGGTFFHNRNDIDQGLLQAAAEPEASYVLGFSPQNMKFDGKYHHLKVSLTNKQRWNLQARHGYFAPRAQQDPEAAAQEELQQAIYSSEELPDLSLACQTQFFKTDKGVRLTIVAHISIKELKFIKEGDRSKDKLTVATAIFDENGNLLTGLEKILQLQLRDATLAQFSRTGVNIKSSFDMQPGTFSVRIVARDSQGSQMGAINRGIVIPD